MLLPTASDDLVEVSVTPKGKKAEAERKVRRYLIPPTPTPTTVPKSVQEDDDSDNIVRSNN